MSRSLRSRLTLSLVAVLAVSLGALALVIEMVTSRALRRQFDERLIDDAVAVAGMAEDEGGVPDFEYESLPDFERAARAAYYEAWLDDGRVLARSPSLGTRDLLRPISVGLGPGFSGCDLPDDRRGRSVLIRRPLRIEPPEAGAPATVRGSNKRVTVVIARDTQALEETIAAVRRWLMLLAGLTLAAACGVGVAVVARGLRSTRAVGTEIAALDVTTLGRVSLSADLPAELVPLVDKVNELLARIKASFAREKRFTADVSHELRTPLAALRMTLDVIGSRERTIPELNLALGNISDVVRQMQGLCENLLALARLDAGSVPVRASELNLRSVVDECWIPFAESARMRGLTFTNEVEPELAVVSDPAHLRIIVTNLLSNAVAYTARGGAIKARVSASAEGTSLEVYDSGPAIPDTALPHLFERFFRGDPSRTDGVHCGIGLTLVRSVSEVLRLSVTAENTPEGGVSFGVRWRGAQQSSARAPAAI